MQEQEEALGGGSGEEEDFADEVIDVSPPVQPSTVLERLRAWKLVSLFGRESPWWKVFKVYEKGRLKGAAVCTLCAQAATDQGKMRAEVKASGGTSNLKSHVFAHHKPEVRMTL
jgi:hypothetical protein